MPEVNVWTYPILFFDNFNYIVIGHDVEILLTSHKTTCI